MANIIYNLFLKRTSGFVLCGIMAAFAVETYINIVGDKIYNSVNKGLLWEHIKDNYNKAEN